MTLTESAKTTAEAQIREIFGRWTNAIREKDSPALLAAFAPGVVVFDLVNPLQYAGVDTLRTRANEWLSSFQGPLGYEVRDLRITAGEDIAFCHSLNGVNGTKINGEKIEMWWRATICFRKVLGRWMVTHEHSSVPFDMATGQASLSIKP